MQRGPVLYKDVYAFKLNFDNGWTMQPKKSFRYGLPERKDLVDASLTFPELRLDVVAMTDLLSHRTSDELICKTPQELPVM